MYGGQSTYIPLKVNSSGVIPIIFASSVLYLPIILAQVLPVEEPVGDQRRATGPTASSGSSTTTSCGARAPFYLAIYGLLIVGFAYFYTAIQFDPHRQADQIRKQGGFIPGIRPGPQTERYLGRILNRITLPGALFICRGRPGPGLRPGPDPRRRRPSSAGTQLGLLRHLDPHRRGRGARDHEADRQPAHDAELRGLPEVVTVVPVISGVRMVMLGRQGAGKGTQCVRLAASLRACPTSRPATCSGPRSRRAPRSAQRAKEVMDAGGLVSDEIMIGVVDERLHQPDTTRAATCSTGSPAPCRQAEALDRIAGELPLHVVINLEVPVERGHRAHRQPPPVRRLRRDLLGRGAAAIRRGTATTAAATSSSATTTPRRPSGAGSTSTSGRPRRSSSTTRSSRLLVEVDGLGADRRGRRPG